MPDIDLDLEGMTQEQLVAEVKKLRADIRQHRDAEGHKPGGVMRSESRARTSRELDLAVMLVLVGYFIDYLVHRI